MSALRRYEILLPLRFNDGQPVPDPLLGEALHELRQRFCAVTWETQIAQRLRWETTVTWDWTAGWAGDRWQWVRCQSRSHA